MPTISSHDLVSMRLGRYIILMRQINDITMINEKSDNVLDLAYNLMT